MGIYSLSVVLLLWLDYSRPLKLVWLWLLSRPWFSRWRLHYDQQEANQAFRHRPLDLGVLYSNLILVHWLSMFYMSLCPLTIVLQALFLLFFYYSLKHQFVTHNNIHLQNSYKLTKIAVFLLEIPLVFSSTLSFILYLMYDTPMEVPQVVTFLLGLFYQFTPTAKINSYFFASNQFKVNDSDQQIFNKFLLQDSINLFES